MKTVTDLIFLGSRITADGDYSHEIKTLAPCRRKAMTNLDSRFITLLTKVYIVKAMIFPVMYGYESWTIKKAEHQRIDTCELWYWRRLLIVPWTARRSNQAILKEISPWNIHWKDWCLTETPLLWPPDVKSWLIRNVPDAGVDWRQEEKGTTKWASPTQWTWVWVGSRW